MQEDYLVTAQSKPSLLLNGETPRLIDEWQDIPVLWDSVRTMVDKRSKPGQFILTGSNTVQCGSNKGKKPRINHSRKQVDRPSQGVATMSRSDIVHI